MNFAEGKGPKQVKQPYVLGQFVTVYGNDGTPGALNPAAVAYSAVQGALTASGQTWAGGQVGSVVPGLNINVNGNGATDVGYVCSPGSNESVQDLQNAGYTLSTDVLFSGSVSVSLQGTANRMWDPDDYNSTHWNTISGMTTTITGGNFNVYSVSASVTGTVLPVYNAYRLIASGTTATGIINWSIAGMFTDMSAMRIGFNSGDANGNLGQMNIQNPNNYTVQSGQYADNEALPSGTWEYAGTNAPYSQTKNNANYYG